MTDSFVYCSNKTQIFTLLMINTGMYSAIASVLGNILHLKDFHFSIQTVIYSNLPNVGGNVKNVNHNSQVIERTQVSFM